MTKKTAKKKTAPPSPLSGLNGQLMVMAAHRYCLGRSSHIVSSGIEWLTAWWDEFDIGLQTVIVKDTVCMLQDGPSGFKADHEAWLEFGRWAFAKLPEVKQAWVRDAVGYKHKDWPL